MDIIFKTYFVILFGLTLVIIYMLILYSKNRKEEINLPDIGSVWFQGSSMIGGLKLIVLTFLPLLNVTHNNIETDKVITIYGGFCVLYISARTLYGKIK